MRKNARDRGVSQDNGCLGDPTSSWLFIAKHVQNGLCKEWWVEFSCFLGYHALFLFSKFKAFCGVSENSGCIVTISIPHAIQQELAGSLK
jgi:hypothetical protein